jgi:hypothetical protein
MAAERPEDVLCMVKYEERWIPSGGVDSQGVLVLDVSPSEGIGYEGRVIPFVRGCASTESAGRAGDSCAGWYSAAMLLVSTEWEGLEDSSPGRFESFYPAFGDAAEVDFEQPWVRASGSVQLLNLVRAAAGDGSPCRFACVGSGGKVACSGPGGLRWIICVVYSLQGCSGTMLKVEAGLCVPPGSFNDAHGVAKWTSCCAPRVLCGGRCAQAFRYMRRLLKRSWLYARRATRLGGCIVGTREQDSDGEYEVGKPKSLMQQAGSASAEKGHLCMRA